MWAKEHNTETVRVDKNNNAWIIMLFKSFCHKIKPFWISPFHHTNSAWTKSALLLSTWGVAASHTETMQKKRDLRWVDRDEDSQKQMGGVSQLPVLRHLMGVEEDSWKPVSQA